MSIRKVNSKKKKGRRGFFRRFSRSSAKLQTGMDGEIADLIKRHKNGDARVIKRAIRMIEDGSDDDVERGLTIINRQINGFGVEALRDPSQSDRFYGDVIAKYVNMGDAYAETVLYDIDEQKVYIGTWESWLEYIYNPRKQEESTF